jgi:ssDNA-binding Zn-finger/Zn-ribbon topoisomerase 1
MDTNLIPIEESQRFIVNNKPICKKCGIPMVSRNSGKGDSKGKPFYGCINFPKCRETIEINS